MGRQTGVCLARIIFTPPLFARVGESIGHYEGGDPLAVDAIDISTKSFIDSYRTPHTDQLHVVERFKLGADGMAVDISIFLDDPGAFTTHGQRRIAGAGSRRLRC
jgi:hypothetical protein